MAGGKVGFEREGVEDELELVDGTGAGEGTLVAAREVVADASESLVKGGFSEGRALLVEVLGPCVVEGVQVVH